ncbi:hypothetical protein K490DRAFT_56898 [Saccharata proteae CBS 121410]|uniref:Uncharacterized protein n=1 Tax=Saccharata proteae CBS 121410 TaxID=1314787 RepID=A0A9P4HV20_9PEZI|nr:hypothetical protein K490DRAFT_56898 [Saccharata proteae CBS 121410]
MIDDPIPDAFDFGTDDDTHESGEPRSQEEEQRLLSGFDLFSSYEHRTQSICQTIDPSTLAATPAHEPPANLQIDADGLDILKSKSVTSHDVFPSQQLTATPTQHVQPQTPDSNQEKHYPPPIPTSFNDFNLFDAPCYSPIPHHAYTAPQNSPAGDPLAAYPPSPPPADLQILQSPFSHPSPYYTQPHHHRYPQPPTYPHHERAHSQPPEQPPPPQPQPTFQRTGGVFLGKPRPVRTQPFPHAQHDRNSSSSSTSNSPSDRNRDRFSKRDMTNRRVLHPYHRHPLQRPGARRMVSDGAAMMMMPGPTSAPGMLPMRWEGYTRAPGAPPLSLPLSMPPAHQAQQNTGPGPAQMTPQLPPRTADGNGSTAQMQMQTQQPSHSLPTTDAAGLKNVLVDELRRMRRDMQALEAYVRKMMMDGSEDLDDASDMDPGTKSLRSDIRARNALVTDASAPLEPLVPVTRKPSLFTEQPAWASSMTGDAIREWDPPGQTTTAALEAHGVTPPEGLFLWQRKELLLRVLGAAREFVGRVLG